MKRAAITENPYLDRTTPELPGETWKPIPGYEEYYEASDLGRVRSLDRTIPHPRLKSQFVKGRILKQKVNVDKNTVSDTPMVYLQVALSKDGKVRYHNVRRLVYSAFIKPLSYEDDQSYVINKDCDGYNNRLSNLTCASVRDKTLRAHTRGRVPESYLSYADRSTWPIIGGNRRPIQQLDMDGKVLRTYESIAEASRATKTDEKGLRNAAKGRTNSCKGFKWRFIETPKK